MNFWVILQVLGVCRNLPRSALYRNLQGITVSLVQGRYLDQLQILLCGAWKQDVRASEITKTSVQILRDTFYS